MGAAATGDRLAAPDLVPGVAKIAVLRANAIGDFIFTLPALLALRAAYPAAEIVLLGKAWHADFLRGRPGPVDRVIVIPPTRGVSEADDCDLDCAQADDFFAQMRDERFDLAVQCHGGGKYSNPFVRRLGARVTAGLKSPEAEPLDRWLAERFAEVGDALAVAGARIVITGASWDRPLATAIQRAMRQPVMDTTGRLTLGGLAGLLSRCAVVVANDSGPLHLARAVGTATVGIYWCFNLVNAGPVETARHWPIISWRTVCPVCGVDRSRGRCDDHPSFVADIPADDVITAALDLLSIDVPA